MPKQEKLFEQFPPVSTRDWMDKITSDLKGADFDKKLVWKTNEGFEVKPFYRREDTEYLAHINKGAQNQNPSWLVRQNIQVEDYYVSNKKALDILMNGTDSLGFVIKDPDAVTEKNFELLLKDIQIENVELNFLCNGKAKEILDILIKISNRAGACLSKIRGAIEADPLSRLMLNGKLCVSFDTGLDYLASLTSHAAILPQFRSVQVTASNFNNAGTDIVQELAFGLSMGNEYMARLTDRNISADVAASKIKFSFGIGSNYFFEIAKLRAARILWSVIAAAYKLTNIDSARMQIHCVTSEWNKTVYDPYVNMLRTQTEAMSAALGGTDSLTVEPFDIVFRNPDEFSERVARNQQLLLKEEAFFDKVADPSAGSYYIENLTALITENSWKQFLEIENRGGFLSALKTGYIRNKINETAARRKTDVSKRKEIFLGTNQYPDFNEAISPEVDIEKIFPSAAEDNENFVKPIRLFRGSEEFDKLRMIADKADKRPIVFMLPVGNPLMRRARSQFSCNFFACGGYKVIDNNGFDALDDGIKVALDARPDIVVICSSDEEYASLAPAVFNRIRNKAIVVIAGNPESVEELKLKGLEYFISVRSDILETLEFFHKKLGLSL